MHNSTIITPAYDRNHNYSAEYSWKWVKLLTEKKNVITCIDYSNPN